MPRAPRNPRYQLHVIIFSLLTPLALANAVYLFLRDDPVMGAVFIFCTVLLALALRQVILSGKKAKAVWQAKQTTVGESSAKEDTT